ncbi:trypsin-like peptidase domain-containing protein [Leucobacter sp. CSA2]|uniref:Trypsin-like peptidase domain-containing protein n=1 Tax=Leucobacter edaphi TaxID=2796472 RepID=A0A934QBW7_9MICO|nr:trypsin-like peptidase domain-containing protein [Leucobacter edaphi]MBK0421015.1 trypsin-like peptidase domain-containing protein [Leucobacter edaphi]
MTTNPEQDRVPGSQQPDAGAGQQGSVPAAPKQADERPRAGDHLPTTPVPDPVPSQHQQGAPSGAASARPFGEETRAAAPAPPAPAYPGDTHATTPLPEHATPAHHGTAAGYGAGSAFAHEAPHAHQAASGSGFGGGGAGTTPPEAPRQHEPAQPHPRSRSGALLAGLAIGALLGGAVGGGVAAVVASNTSSSHTVTQQGTGGTITLKNAENATEVSGVAAVALPSVVTIEVASSGGNGSGSGVVVSEDGYIVSNAHVITLDGAVTTGQSLRVKLSDGRIMPAKVVGLDPYADLALIKVEANNLTPIKYADSNDLNIGDLTVAIGAPLNLANTVTSGIVSATNRGISVSSPLIPQEGAQRQQDGGSGEDPWDFRYGLPNQQQQPQQAAGTATLPVIQTDASINPGNSGGALLNGHGELIGINVAIASATSSQGTAGSDGLGFAIPSDLVKRVVNDLMEGKQPTHGLMGASVADSSQDTDADANNAGGLLVEVARGGAADKAGLRQGDVVTAIDGVPAVDGTSVSALVRMHEGGSTVTVNYTRNGKPGETKATLGDLEWKSSK